MMFGIWQSSNHALPEPLASRVDALLKAPGRTRVDQGKASVTVAEPARLEQRGPIATSWAAAGPGGVRPPWHPTLQLEGGTLTLSSPPLPQYPLYYVRPPGDGYLLASSRLEPLARLLPHSALSAQRIVSIVRRCAGAVDPDGGATVYAEIRRLLPSETVIAGPEGVRVERSLPRIGRSYRQGRVADLAAELRYQLDAAVGRAIGPSKRVAVLVSGGLDSSGVLALAAARFRGASERELHAISLQFDGPGDDRPYLTELVAALGLEPVRLTAADAGNWFRQSLCVDGQPGCGGSGTCLEMLFYATAASLGAGAVLCGSAGDAICGGPLPFAQLALRGHVLRAVDAALRIRLPWPATRWGRVRPIVRAILPVDLLPPVLRRNRRPRSDRSAWMTLRFRALLERCRDAAERAPSAAPDSPDEWMQELCEGDGCLLSNSADVGGQALAVTSAGAVDVFMDFDFVRFMLELDPVLLSCGHEYRGLYRLAMKGLLPESIRTRQDKALFPPVIAAAALAANALDTLRDLSSLSELATRDLVDPGPFRPMFEEWLGVVRRGEGKDLGPGGEFWEQVWQLLSVEAFLREHGTGRSLS